ncbi:MAG: cytochrome b/b6 domain-containing protein [Caldimicrobium sp.]
MGKIKRYGAVVRFEHWLIAFSGIMLIFTGLGCLPLFKRYYITEIPGLRWTADFYLLTKLHYIFAIFFTFAIFFHIFFHVLRKDFGLLPKRGDFSNSIKMILASFGIGKEPPSDKWLPEQRFAYLGIGLVALAVLITGILKVIKNLEVIPFPPSIESLLNLLHTIFGGIFILLFLIHIFFVLAIKSNWPLLKAMITGEVDEEYVRHRHALWYEKIKGKD